MELMHRECSGPKYPSNKKHQIVTKQTSSFSTEIAQDDLRRAPNSSLTAEIGFEAIFSPI